MPLNTPCRTWTSPLAGILAVLALGLLSGCAGAGPSPSAAPQPEPAVAPDHGGTHPLSAAEIEAIYRERLAGARTRFSEADVRFMTDMIHHHAQALEMAVLAPTHGASTAVQALAGRILISQQDEITLMRQWLEDRGRPAPTVDLETGRMTDPAQDHDSADHDHHPSHGHHHHDTHGPGAPGHDHAMPGMIDEDRMGLLATSHGEAFDRLFLTLMIEHHEGAVTMVRDLFASDGAGQDEEIFRFASDVHADQVIEVARMRLLLTSLGGPPDLQVPPDSTESHDSPGSHGQPHHSSHLHPTS